MNSFRLRELFLLFRYPSILLPAALLACCALAGGCTEKNHADDKQLLRFYTWKPNQPEVWDEIIRMFEAEHPGVKVRREIGPHSSTAFHDLLSQKLKNRSPDLDVFLMDVVWPAEFAAAGWASALNKRFSKAEQDLYLPNTIEANTYNGKIYGVPIFIDSGILYYRKDLLDQYGFEPPKTWAEMASQARTITAKEPDLYGFSAQFKQYEGLVCNMLEYITSNQGSLVNRESGKPTVADPPAVAAVRFVRDRIIGETAPIGVLTYEEPESLALFIQGKAVFHRNWPYAWEAANNPERSRVAGKVGIAQLPHFPGGKSHAALGGWQAGISAYSENKDLAWIFVRYLTSSRIQKHLALKASLAPTRTMLYEDAEILRACPQFRDMKPIFLSAVARPVSPLYPSLSNIMQRFFSKAISDSSTDIAREARIATSEMKKTLALVP
jgi:multiple sugar transport system substrate-binding protein